MHKHALLAAMVFLLICGCSRHKPKFTAKELDNMPLAQKTGLPPPSGGFVLSVGGETITCDEVIAPTAEHLAPIAQRTSFARFANEARPILEQILAARISTVLLSQEAKKKGGDNIDKALEEAVDEEARRFISSFKGDTAKAEEALKGMGMNWAGFKEYQKKMILCQSYIQSQLPADRPVTYSELVEGYNKMKEEFFARPAMLTFRLIDIQIAKVDASDPNTSRLQQARKLVDEIIEKLVEGSDFGVLAKQYSHDHRREFGGLWKPVQPDSLARPYSILAFEAQNMERGQIAGPIETEGHIFIMKLEDKQGKSIEPFENVQREVEAKILFDRRKQAIDKFSMGLLQEISNSRRTEFTDFCLERLYKISNQ